MHLPFFASRRIFFCRLVEAAPVIRTKVDDDKVRLPRRKIPFSMGAKFFIPPAEYKSAYFVIIFWKRTAAVIIPRAGDTPAALRKNMKVSIAFFCRKNSVIVVERHPSRNPVHLLLAARKPLSRRY